MGSSLVFLLPAVIRNTMDCSVRRCKMDLDKLDKYKVCQSSQDVEDK